MIKQMKRLANNTSRRMHREVELHTINGDNNRSKIQQASWAFLIAKRLVADLPITPTNDVIYSIVDDIQVGLYDDLGDIQQCDRNWEQWLQRTKEILQSQGRLVSYDLSLHKAMIEEKD